MRRFNLKRWDGRCDAVKISRLLWLMLKICRRIKPCTSLNIHETRTTASITLTLICKNVQIFIRRNRRVAVICVVVIAIVDNAAAVRGVGRVASVSREP